jgi:predicted nucleic acid-binding protein
LANSRRNQGYLGIDSNVLVAYLLPDHPDHDATKTLVRRNHAVNPTVIHETYHASVFRMKRNPRDTVRTLLDYIDLVLTLPIDMMTVRRGLRLAAKHSLGGRDALILASYLLSRQVGTFVTMDKSLLALKEMKLGTRTLEIVSPATL